MAKNLLFAFQSRDLLAGKQTRRQSNRVLTNGQIHRRLGAGGTTRAFSGTVGDRPCVAIALLLKWRNPGDRRVEKVKRAVKRLSTAL